MALDTQTPKAGPCPQPQEREETVAAYREALGMAPAALADELARVADGFGYLPTVGLSPELEAALWRLRERVTLAALALHALSDENSGPLERARRSRRDA